MQRGDVYMASKKDTVQITFRAPASVIVQLDELCKMSRSPQGERG